jgi:hypothetical protein
MIPHAALSAPSVSQWSVGKHIDHCCLAIQRICGALAESTPPVKGRRTALGVLVFTLGSIPRGRGKAPEASVPSEEPTEAKLIENIELANQAIASAQQLDPDAWFRHFVFGTLKRDRSIVLLNIHNNHHLKIIADIHQDSGTSPA